MNEYNVEFSVGRARDGAVLEITIRAATEAEAVQAATIRANTLLAPGTIIDCNGCRVLA